MRSALSPPLRRTSRLAVAAAALALLATACGSGSGGDAEAGKPVTIAMWSWMKGTEATVAEFNRTHDDIQVKFSEITGGADGYAKISNAVKAGNAPDVAGVEYLMVPELASQGQLTDLTDIAGDFVVKNFPRAEVDLVTPGGPTWSVPYDTTPMLFYYRTDLFKKHSIEVPETWDEFKNAAGQFKAAGSDLRIASIPTNETSLMAGLAWQAGARWFDTQGDAWKVGIEDKASLQVMEYWDGLLEDDLVHNYPAWSEEETKARLSGDVAGFIGASWSGGPAIAQMPDLSGKWGVAPLPHWGKPATGMYGGTSFAVLKGSEKTEAAVEFIKWLTTDPAATKARLSGQSGPSTALPANQQLQKVAADAFDNSYFSNDLFAIAAAEAHTIRPGWTWGPVQSVVNGAQSDAASRSGFVASLAAAQKAAEEKLKDRGLKTVP